MSGATMAVLAATAAVGTAYSIYSGERGAAAQKNAQSQAEAQAQQQAAAVAQQTNAIKQQTADTQAQADQATNRANQKQPDTSAILSAASQSSKGGASGTMLTGPSGIDPSLLTLGKSTLLGQ